jgi:hypothetical protein
VAIQQVLRPLADDLDGTGGHVVFLRVGAGLSVPRRDGVDDGLGFGEFGDGQRAAQPAGAALLVAALGEAVVDRGPGVGPDGAGLDLAADPAAGADAAGEQGRREAEFGGVGPRDGLGLRIEDLSRVLGQAGLTAEGPGDLARAANIWFRADLSRYLAPRPGVLTWNVMPGPLPPPRLGTLPRLEAGSRPGQARRASSAPSPA